MKILIVAATPKEIEPLLQRYKISFNSNAQTAADKSGEINFLVTGVGMVNTAYRLALEFSRWKPDLCINAGIAGSFKHEFPIGKIVRVREDAFSELGAEDGDNFLTIDEIGFGTQTVREGDFAKFFNPKLEVLPLVKSISVNKVHGNEESISKIKIRCNPDIESMEGAAFMMACINENVKHVQLRSISNFVERRNRENWNIPLAVKNLNDFLIDLIPALR